MTQEQRKQLADVLCDLGKYIATAIPVAYFVANKPGIGYVMMATIFFGLLFVIFGLYFVKSSESNNLSNARKRKVKILKNAVFQIEEQQL